MKELNTTIKTYDMGNDFRMDIVLGTHYECWIYKENYGIKQFGFGMHPNTISLTAFIELAEMNFNEYKEIYTKDYITMW